MSFPLKGLLPSLTYFILISTVIHAVLANDITVKRHRRPFDYFLFVQQWPGSYCDTVRSCCYPSRGKPAAFFSIHGLWPNYLDGTWPEYCDSNAPFDPQAIADMLPNLEAHWDSLACHGGENSFWKHEWEKHGTCSEQAIGREHDYFATALALYKRIDVTAALATAGIVPSDDVAYSVRDIVEAMYDATGVMVNVNCNDDAQGRKQILEIYTCVDSDGTTLIDCPTTETKCPRYVSYPVFSGPSATATQ